MLKSIFMLSKYLKKTVTAALILGLMISPILPATQSISSSISIATQAAEIEVQLEEAQASTGYWNDYTDTAWYYDNQNENENEYTITTAEELAGLAKLVNDGTCNFEGKTIKLADNINLGDHYWVPIGVDNTKPFRGNFDGQGYTISNMHIGTSEATPAEYDYTGLFGFVENANIQYVDIKGSSKIYASAKRGNNDNTFFYFMYPDLVPTNYVGGICGFARNSSISFCSNAAYIYGGNESGGICGKVDNSTTIKGCSNSGDVFSPDALNEFDYRVDNVGGICANIEFSSIEDCTNSGIVTSRFDLTENGSGGICGRIKSSTIKNCHNRADISGSVSGGICGKVDNSTTIKDCSNSGNIVGFYSGLNNMIDVYSGGICAKSLNTLLKILDCSNSGNVSKATHAGGILGVTMSMGTVSDCSNSGTISATEEAGGICGRVGNGSIRRCINVGQITSESEDGKVGGICAYITTRTEIINTYYKVGTTERGIGIKASAVREDLQNDEAGKTTALPESQMTAAASTTNGQGWVDITINGANKGKISLVDALNYELENSEYVWTQKDGVNNNYPYPLSTWLIGDGIYVDTQWYDNNIEADDYTINTAEELAGLAKLVNIDGIDFSGVTITLGDNINLSAHNWEPIGTKETPFKGTFDGNNKTISGMHIDALENQKQLGLFGNVESGTIKNVNIDEDCYISTYQNTASAGGICGYASNGLGIVVEYEDEHEITNEVTTISNCSSKATIIANSKSLSQIGGIVGATSGVTINNCHNMGSVKVQLTSKENTGEHNVGGIVGYCVGATDIIGCINEGDVLSSVNGDASAKAGGIVGAASHTPTIYKKTNEETTKKEKIIGVVKIKNCQNFGNVKSSWIWSKVNPIYNKLTTNLSYAGGIIGEPGKKTEVTNCISLGIVTADKGWTEEVKKEIEAPEKSEEKKKLAEEGKNEFNEIPAYAGGICGGSLLDLNELKIENCAFGGNVEATTDLPNQISDTCAGGIYGKIETEANATITISNCYYKKGAAATGIANEVDQAGEITALPESQMTAAEGTIDGEGWVDITLGNIQEKRALVDALNYYVDNNLNNGLLNWIQDDDVNDGYPTIVTNNNNAN